MKYVQFINKLTDVVAMRPSSHTRYVQPEASRKQQDVGESTDVFQIATT